MSEWELKGGRISWILDDESRFKTDAYTERSFLESIPRSHKKIEVFVIEAMTKQPRE